MFGTKRITVAINGFGRIGRAFYRAARDYPALNIVAINDLGDAENAAYLLRHDSVYGKFPEQVGAEAGKLRVGGEIVAYLSEKDPAKLPWSDMNIDVVVESTGVFESYDKASAHLTAGAKRVVISAPAKSGAGEGTTILMGVNEEKLKGARVTSNASCTTNAVTPVIAILNEALGVKKAILNTVHAYTATQSIVDSPAKGDFRRGRAAAHNIVPSTTGAAKATTKALTELEGLFDGISVRVPVVAGSLIDLTFIAARETTVEEVNAILARAAGEKRWSRIFSVTTEQLVSSDIVGSSHASIADLAFTRVVGGDLVKVLAWYDNEFAYAHTLAQHVEAAGRRI